MVIKTLSTKTVPTKYGDREKYIITDETGKMFDSFKSKWNSSWKVGDEIKITPNQIKEREYQGKKYYIIQAPPEAKQFGGQNNQVLIDGLKGIMDLLVKIDSKQDQILKIVGFSEPPAEDINI